MLLLNAIFSRSKGPRYALLVLWAGSVCCLAVLAWGLYSYGFEFHGWRCAVCGAGVSKPRMDLWLIPSRVDGSEAQADHEHDWAEQPSGWDVSPDRDYSAAGLALLCIAFSAAGLFRALRQRVATRTGRAWTIGAASSVALLVLWYALARLPRLLSIEAYLLADGEEFAVEQVILPIRGTLCFCVSCLLSCTCAVVACLGTERGAARCPDPSGHAHDGDTGADS